MELFGKYLGSTENWKRSINRVLRGKKVCRNCWRFPFACLHIDKEVWEALAKAWNDPDRPIRKLSPRKVSTREENNGETNP